MEDAALLIAAACFIALLVVLYVCITSAVVPKALHPDKKVRERERKKITGFSCVCVCVCVCV